MSEHSQTQISAVKKDKEEGSERKGGVIVKKDVLTLLYEVKSRVFF